LADPWGASGNAPGSGTAELTKLEIRPVWTTTRSRAGGAGAIETPTPGAVLGFYPGRWALPHHRDTRSYMAAFIPQWNGIGLRIGTSA